MSPRRAVPDEDLAPLLALVRRAFAGMEGRIDPPSSVHRLTVQDIARQAAEGEVWVLGAPPVACLFLTRQADALYLSKLAVDPGAQRQGHGARLVGVAAARARALGLARLRLQTRAELAENHAAFRAMGFVQVAATAHPGFDRPTSLTFEQVV